MTATATHTWPADVEREIDGEIDDVELHAYLPDHPAANEDGWTTLRCRVGWHEDWDEAYPIYLLDLDTGEVESEGVVVGLAPDAPRPLCMQREVWDRVRELIADHNRAARRAYEEEHGRGALRRRDFHARVGRSQ